MVDLSVSDVLRLIFLSCVNAGLFALLAVRSDVERSGLFEQSAEFYVLWIGLFIVYAMAIRTAGSKSDASVTAVIFLAAAGFRATTAHLADVRTRIEKALDAAYVITP